MTLGALESALIATEFVAALEQDTNATYVYIGPLEEGDRFLAVTFESAQRLHGVLAQLLSVGRPE